MPPASGPAVTPDPSDIERYARAAAVAAGLEVDEAWWPDVVGHLAGMLGRAASLETDEFVLPEDLAPVFRP